MAKRNFGPVVRWNDLSGGLIPLAGVVGHDGTARGITRGRQERASRIGQAINQYEAALGGGLESFAAETLVLELESAGLGGVVCGGLEYRLVPDGPTGGTALQRRREERAAPSPKVVPESDPSLPDEADRFLWDGDDAGEPENNLFLSGKMVGYVYEPTRGSWAWVYGDGPDWSDWSHIPEADLTRSFRAYDTEAEAKAALEAYAWAKD